MKQLWTFGILPLSQTDQTNWHLDKNSSQSHSGPPEQTTNILQKLKRDRRFQLFLQPSSDKMLFEPTKHTTWQPCRQDEASTTAVMQRPCMQTTKIWLHLLNSIRLDEKESSDFTWAELSACKSPRDTDRVPGRPSVKKVYIAISGSPLNPPLSLYGSGLLVKPMSWQGHEIQYSVICPLPRLASL